MAVPIQYSDADLVNMLKNEPKSSDIAILALYENYYSILSNFVLNNGGNEQDAEDIFQESIVSFIDMVKNDKYRQEASIKTMLYTINRNIWYTEVTKRGKAKTRNRLYVAENEIEEKNIDEYIGQREAREELLKIIEQLGAQCKEILLLFYYENLSMKEIYEKTSYESEQSVRNKKSKCLKKMEQLMTEDPNLYTKLKNIFTYVK
jgi:RNA polymerase sigma factor (sigma-70 family)